MRSFAQQKAGLTRAVRSGSPSKVVEECTRTVREWESQEWADAHKVRRGAWPDAWHRWNIAVSDATKGQIQLDDLR